MRPDQPQTATTGQVIAAQNIADSGLNLQNKDSLSRAWDIHAERALKCTDCHYALNNPVHSQEAASARPSHLVYDPRQLEIGEYLQRPDHNFARGESAQYTVDPDQKGSMRRCESCHDAEDSHSDWLPYTEPPPGSAGVRKLPHPGAVCTGHQQRRLDRAQHGRQRSHRAAAASRAADTITGLVTGFQPVLMQRTNVDGDTLLAPYNLITSWYWVYDDPSGDSYPVRLIDLQAAYFQGGTVGDATRRRFWPGLMPTGTASSDEPSCASTATPSATWWQVGWRHWG